jgi:hypothetical protein
MKKIIILIIIGLSSILYCDIMQIRTSGFNLNMFEQEIIDSRAEALGKASLLSSSGANFVFNNPSMLSKSTNTNFQFNCRAIFGKSECNTESVMSEYDIKYKCHTKINGISTSIPFQIQKSNKIRFSLAAGYQVFYDRGYNFIMNLANDELHINKSGGFNTFVLGGSLSLKNKYFVGLSYNYPFLSTTTNEFTSEAGTYDETKTKNALNASFISFSASYVLNNIVTIATRFNPDFELNINNITDENSNSKTKYFIPFELAISVEISPYKRIKLYTEYLTRNLGEFKINDDYIYSLAQNNRSENGYTIRTGLEFGNNGIYRLGMYKQSVPVYKLDDIEPDTYTTKPQTEVGFTLGYGLKMFTNINIDFFGAYSFLNYEESTGFYSNKYSDARIRVGCSIGYTL